MAFTVSNGEVWDAFLANAALGTIPDGQTDLPGHSPKIIDDWLDDGVNQIKARFYNWYNDFRVSISSGLTVNYDSGNIFSDTGLTVLPSGNLIVPNNQTSFIIIDENLNVTTTSTIPNRCYPMARVTASAGVITELIDIRNQNVNTLKTFRETSVFSPGDTKLTMRKTVDSGWLLCDGSYIDPQVYSDLFNVIGYTFGQSGSLFRLPLGGRTIISNGDGLNVGQLIGSDQIVLTRAQLPRHTHNASQIPHSHSVNDTGHNHGSYNLGHSHGVVQQPHSHSVSDFGHEHTLNPSTAIDTFKNGQPASGYGAGSGGGGLGGVGSEPTNRAISNISVQAQNASISIQNTPLNLATNNSTSGVNVNPANANINIGETGNNDPIDIRQASLVLNMWIKT